MSERNCKIVLEKKYVYIILQVKTRLIVMQVFPNV